MRKPRTRRRRVQEVLNLEKLLIRHVAEIVRDDPADADRLAAAVRERIEAEGPYWARGVQARDIRAAMTSPKALTKFRRLVSPVGRIEWALRDDPHDLGWYPPST